MDWLGIKEYFATFSYKILLALVIFTASIVVITLITRASRRLLNRIRIDSTIKTLLLSLIRFMLWVLSTAIILNILGFKEISLALGGSIMVIGLGLANSISSVAADLIAGIFLLADEDFRVGSLVQSSGIKGVVESLDIRKTRIRDQEGNLHIIANRNIDNNNLKIFEQK